MYVVYVCLNISGENQTLRSRNTRWLIAQYALLPFRRLWGRRALGNRLLIIIVVVVAPGADAVALLDLVNQVLWSWDIPTLAGQVQALSPPAFLS